MANTIKIKRGLKTNLPTLAVGEMGYCTDTNELFIGTNEGNELINEDSTINELGDIGDVATTTPSSGQVLKWNGSQWAPATDNNTTYSEISETEIRSTTSSTARLISGRRLNHKFRVVSALPASPTTGVFYFVLE